MLKDNLITKTDPELQNHGFFVTVEIDKNVATEDFLEEIADNLADALSWLEGTGFIDVSYAGTMVDEDYTEGEAN